MSYVQFRVLVPEISLILTSPKAHYHFKLIEQYPYQQLKVLSLLASVKGCDGTPDLLVYESSATD